MRSLAFSQYPLEEAGSFNLLKPSYASNAKDCPVSVIRKEWMVLTGNPFKAIVLNQLLYWSQRVKDVELWLEEEKNVEAKEGSPLQHGWIYKTAHELINETLLGVHRTTMRRYLNVLIQKGWIDQRSNPSDKWDKRIQYRVNLRKIQRDLLTFDLRLPDYLKRFLLDPCISTTTETSNVQDAPVNVEGANWQNAPSNVQDAPSNVTDCSFIDLTETTTEQTTNKEHTRRARESTRCEGVDQTVFSPMVEIWKKHIGQNELHPTEKRTQHLESLLSLYFQNDLSQWEAFCKRVKASPFLMGRGPQHWRVSLDWICCKHNLLKVLEGNFDSPEALERQQKENVQRLREDKTQAVLASIQDPLWKKWCWALSEFPPPGVGRIPQPLSGWQLERMANAQFVKFDGRLVILGSSDPKVLDEIETLEHPIASVVARDFPTSKSVITRRLEDRSVSQAPPTQEKKQC